MIYFTAHTFNCVCHCIRAMFRVLGMYNFGRLINQNYATMRVKQILFTSKIISPYCTLYFKFENTADYPFIIISNLVKNSSDCENHKYQDSD